MWCVVQPGPTRVPKPKMIPPARASRSIPGEYFTQLRLSRSSLPTTQAPSKAPMMIQWISGE